MLEAFSPRIHLVGESPRLVGWVELGTVGDEGDAGESLLEAERPLGVILRHSVELFLVAFHLFDEVYEMERLLELLEVLSIDHVAEFVLNANDELNDVE